MCIRGSSTFCKEKTMQNSRWSRLLLSFEETGGNQMNNKKEIGEALDLCIELLEKATPKKPIFEAMRGFGDEIASHLVCPVCKIPIVNVWSRKEYRPRYCHVCGQRLDWSE